MSGISKKLIKLTFIYLAGILIIFPIWTRLKFGINISIDQILFHFISEIYGSAEGTDNRIRINFILANLVLPLFFPLLYSYASILINKNPDIEKRTISTKRLDKGVVILLIVAITTFVFNLHLYQYVNSRFGRDIFSSLYSDPKKQQFDAPARKKNLILIYVESLETDLSDLKPGHIDAIKEINDLPGRQVKGFLQAPGTEWSIAGMIASQAGIPLKPFFGNDAGSYIKNGYFPNLISLSDILAKEGYVQYFLVGPDLRFGGMKKFYSAHHYDHTIGLNEWKSLGLDKKYFNGWGQGLHDDDLLDQAYKIITENRSNHQKYAITIETTDSHAPDGFLSPRCGKSYKNGGFIGAFKYTSYYLANFINKLILEGVLADTDIIIMGDHLFMANESQLKEHFSSNRYIYFKMITAENRIPNRDRMTHFDVAPTILDLLGIRRNTNQHFGLGISLFATIEPAEYEHHLRQVMSNEILSPSIIYDHFWDAKNIPKPSRSSIF